MSRLDEITKKYLPIERAISEAELFDDVLWLLQVARKAEEMAKFYTDQFVIDVTYVEPVFGKIAGQHINKWKDNGVSARVFLSFLEEGK